MMNISKGLFTLFTVVGSAACSNVQIVPLTLVLSLIFYN